MFLEGESPGNVIQALFRFQVERGERKECIYSISILEILSKIYIFYKRCARERAPLHVSYIYIIDAMCGVWF